MTTPPVFDDLHIIANTELSDHAVAGGPGGCICEPVVVDVFRIGNLVRRTILHQHLADTEQFYDAYARRRDADHRRN